MGRKACTEPQWLYKGELYLFPALCTADLESISLNVTCLAYIKGDLLLPHSVSEQDGFKPIAGNSKPVKQLNSSGIIICEVYGRILYPINCLWCFVHPLYVTDFVHPLYVTDFVHPLYMSPTLCIPYMSPTLCIPYMSPTLCIPYMSPTLCIPYMSLWGLFILNHTLVFNKKFGRGFMKLYEIWSSHSGQNEFWKSLYLELVTEDAIWDSPSHE